MAEICGENLSRVRLVRLDLLVLLDLLDEVDSSFYRSAKTVYTKSGGRRIVSPRRLLMRKRITPAFLAVAVLLIAASTKAAFGQITGCVDSPEDPTVVMAGLGFIAAAAPFAWSRIRNRTR